MEKALVPSPVEFHDGVIYMVVQEGQPFVPMKPVVEGMGLDWRSQQAKIRTSERYGDITIPLDTPGGLQEMLSIPLKKLNGWLFSINPEKVKPELKNKVILYQEESFQVLHDYWNNGLAENPRKNDNAGFFERQHREFKALKSIGKNKGLNEKERIRFAAEKMIQRYGDSEKLYDISHLGSGSVDEHPEESKSFYATMDRLLEAGEIEDHGDRTNVVWIHMPTALSIIESDIGRDFDRNILYHQLKFSDRYIEQKNNKRSPIFKKPIRAWAFKKI